MRIKKNYYILLEGETMLGESANPNPMIKTRSQTSSITASLPLPAAMATAALNTPVANWYSCKHDFECHKLRADYLHSFIIPVNTSVHPIKASQELEANAVQQRRRGMDVTCEDSHMFTK